MTRPLSYWKNLYEELKGSAICIDIERAQFNRPIAVVGWAEPRDGLVECNHLVRGTSLTLANLRELFSRYRLLITFNGRSYDIPAIDREFPGAIGSGRAVLDLYILARRLGLTAGLKTLESTFRIERLDGNLKKGSALRLWRRYEQQGDRHALDELLAYNKQDTVNLHPLAEELMRLINDD